MKTLDLKAGQLVRVDYEGNPSAQPKYGYITKRMANGFYFKSSNGSRPVFVSYESIDQQNQYGVTVRVTAC